MIRFAKEEDIKDIMYFIDNYWKKGHILGNNMEFFCFQYQYDDEVSFVISRNDKTSEVEAVLGYIPYNSSGNVNRDVVLALWKANKTDNPTLGMNLLIFLKENANARIIFCNGINKKTFGIYKYLGYSVDKMKHWYRLNVKSDYKIAAIKNAEIPAGALQTFEYEQFKCWNDFIEQFDAEKYNNICAKPFKSLDYIKKRYFEHPVFNYLIYGVKDEKNEIKSVYFLRKVLLEENCVIRFIDCIGDFNTLKELNILADRLMKEENAEYLDLYEYGLEDSILTNAGFIYIKETENIIPNYFAPFVQENVDINISTTDKDIVMFKGDGDQDRPN